MAWLTSALADTFTSTDDGWNGYTIATVINAAQISNTGGSQVRVTVRGGVGEGAAITSCYIGMAAASGDAWDFATTPVQLLFSGSASVTAGAGADVVSDAATFSITASQNLIVCAYCNSGANDNVAAKVGGNSGWMSYWAGGDHSAEVDKGPFASQGRNILVKQVESFFATGARRMTTLGVG